MYDIKYCPNCAYSVLSSQNAWINDIMIVYHVCPSCEGIETERFQKEVLSIEKEWFGNKNAYILNEVYHEKKN